MTGALAVFSRIVAAGAPFFLTHALQPATKSRPVVQATTTFSRNTSAHLSRRRGWHLPGLPAHADPVAACITDSASRAAGASQTSRACSPLCLLALAFRPSDLSAHHYVSDPPRLIARAVKPAPRPGSRLARPVAARRHPAHRRVHRRRVCRDQASGRQLACLVAAARHPAPQRARRRRGGRDRARWPPAGPPSSHSLAPGPRNEHVVDGRAGPSAMAADWPAQQAQVGTRLNNEHDVVKFVATQHEAAQLITRAVKPAPRPGSRLACPRAGAPHPSSPTSTPSPSSS